MTQAELVGPDGVGLLVYGSGIHWGTAYLGPDGHAPDSAGTLVAVPPAPAPARPGAWPGGRTRARAGSGGHRGRRDPGTGTAAGRRRAGGAAPPAAEAGQAERGSRPSGR